MASASTVNRRMSGSFEERHSSRTLGASRQSNSREAVRAEALDLRERGGGIVEQRRDVHPLAARRERRQVARSARQHVDRAVVIQPPQVMERDADLQDALVEIADVAALGAPEQLQRLVLLEELAAIELRDPFEQLRRRRFGARHGVILMRMIEKRRSKIQGWGVYATQTISKNTRIIDYAGEKISNQESLKREARYIKNGHIWCFKLTNRTVIDAGVGGNVARFINHSCRPNCYIHILDGIIWIRAARNDPQGRRADLPLQHGRRRPDQVPLPPGMSAPAVIPRHVFYLHGFASSPKSTKVGYFTDRLLEHGIGVRCPDFNQPDFTTLTLTRMLDRLGGELAALDGEPATLIGSSLGGTLAILAAARFAPQVDRLVLLAPAVMFAKPGHHLLPPERIDEWRRRGALPFFHYADRRRARSELRVLRGQPAARRVQRRVRSAGDDLSGGA